MDMLARLTSDLVDEDDRDPAWLDSIADPYNSGPIRPRIREVIERALPSPPG